jgi:hypothetical protein
MTYFKDLADYPCDHRDGSTTIVWLGLHPEDSLSPPRIKCVGWLASSHAFPTQTPSEGLLDLLWDYCAISVNQTRGIHACSFCPQGDKDVPPFLYAERNGQRKLLGSAEIRVFGDNGNVYAAPTLIYHYVSMHDYRPPAEFVDATRLGPRPPSQEYFVKLNELRLEWNKAALPQSL